MPQPGHQIYIRTRATLVFNLQNLSFHALWTACANWHQNQFIQFQNIVFASLEIDK